MTHLEYFQMRLNIASDHYIRAVRAGKEAEAAKYQGEIDSISDEWDRFNGHEAEILRRQTL